MASIIPFLDFPAFVEEIEIDNSVYRLSFHWNCRGEYWSMTIADRNGNNIIAGIKLTINYDCIRQHLARAIPQGSLTVIDIAARTAYDKIERRDMYEERDLKFAYMSTEEFS